MPTTIINDTTNQINDHHQQQQQTNIEDKSHPLNITFIIDNNIIHKNQKKEDTKPRPVKQILKNNERKSSVSV